MRHGSVSATIVVMEHDTSATTGTATSALPEDHPVVVQLRAWQQRLAVGDVPFDLLAGRA